jgi:hypothetical protein
MSTELKDWKSLLELKKLGVVFTLIRIEDDPPFHRLAIGQMQFPDGAVKYWNHSYNRNMFSDNKINELTDDT